VFAKIVTFGNITLLQFVDFPLFLFVLLLMHGGIVGFIIQRKRFVKAGLAVRPYFHRTYLLLALFLPILGYSLGALIFGYPVDEPAKQIVVLVLAGIAIIASLFNTLSLRAFLQKSTDSNK
jgi:hypothetical protein